MRDGSHSITVAGPVLYYLAATDKAATPLAPIKEFMSDHAVIMMVVPLVLGAKLPGQGLAGITPDTRPPGGDMLTALTDLPDNVLGFEASGEIHADDYTTILVPAIERRLAEGTNIRIVLVFEHWDGVSGGAARQDLKMGVEHLTRWKKMPSSPTWTG